MNTLFNFMVGKTNYAYMNQPNLFNFLTIMYDMMGEDKKKDFVRMMKLHIGLSFYDQYRQYLVRKAPHHELLKLSEAHP